MTARWSTEQSDRCSFDDLHLYRLNGDGLMRCRHSGKAHPDDLAAALTPEDER